MSLHLSHDNFLTNNTCTNNKWAGIKLDRSLRGTITNNSLNDNSDYGIRLYLSEHCLINENIIADNGDGILIKQSLMATITWNTITGNGKGIIITSLSRYSFVHYNDIMGNDMYGIDASANDGYDSDARENWWGDNSGPYHPEKNSNGKGDNVTYHVDFDPWIRKEIPAGNILYVDNDSPEGGDGSRERPFKRIQDAIDAAGKGDSIRVWEGIYYENVVANKTVSLIGNGSSLTMVNGSSGRDVFHLTAHWVNISGFSLTGGGGDWPKVGSGIKVDSDHNTIFNNTCSNNGHGISVNNSVNNLMSHNICESNEYTGIDLNESFFNTIVNNRCSHNWDGISLDDSDHNYFTNNTLEWNKINAISLFYSINNIFKYNEMVGNSIKIYGNKSAWNSHQIDTTNRVNGKPLFYFSDRKDMAIPKGSGAVILANCSNIVIEDQSFNNVSNGILVGHSSHIFILNNTCSDTIGNGYYRQQALRPFSPLRYEESTSFIQSIWCDN